MAADHHIRIAALSACLSLVRPVGMTEDETVDWLEVANDTLAHIPADILERGARSARGICTHHAQIVPTIIAETREALAWRSRPSTAPLLRLVAPEPPPPVERAPLPDPEELHAPLRRMGIAAGWLAEGADGHVVWTEEGAA